MAKKNYFLIIDTETTQDGKVADFGAVVTCRKGTVHHSVGALVREFYLDQEKHPLFHTRDADPLWGAAKLPARYAAYDDMLQDGRRSLYSVAAINRWLSRVNAQYSPIVTAYNLAFDADKMDKSGIDARQFEKSFCLWHAAANKWAHGKPFRQFIIDNHYFNKPTAYKNMSYLTNAEVMARFVLNNPDMPDEPHTALEDALDYELPILKALVKDTPVKTLFDPPSYSWRNYQVRDWFIPK